MQFDLKRRLAAEALGTDIDIVGLISEGNRSCPSLRG